MVCEIVRLHVRKIIVNTVNKIKVATCSKRREILIGAHMSSFYGDGQERKMK